MFKKFIDSQIKQGVEEGIRKSNFKERIALMIKEGVENKFNELLNDPNTRNETLSFLESIREKEKK